jgi:hypothetical protein
MSEADIVEHLGTEVLNTIQHQRDLRQDRFGDKKGFL